MAISSAASVPPSNED